MAGKKPDRREKSVSEERARINALNKEWRLRNPDKNEDMRLRRLYGITLESFRELGAAQGHVCLLCKEERKLCVDHCHETGRIRGLLCRQCNSGLGYFQDSPELLQTAATWLAGQKEKSS